MRRPEFIARQARCPTGILGSLLARIMAAETAPENERALELLDLQPRDHVLDVGCGHGRTLARAARAVPEGFVAGVDVSERMVRMATRRNAELVQRGRVEVRLADSCRVPYPDQHFDKVCAVHVLYFWPDPLANLREIHRVMKPGARLVLGFRSSEDARAVADLPASVYRFYPTNEVRTLLEAAGFPRVEIVMPNAAARGVVYAVALRKAH
jgi:ubiquinone/menaquinone biosynthesis C-methylase UbiE